MKRYFIPVIVFSFIAVAVAGAGGPTGDATLAETARILRAAAEDLAAAHDVVGERTLYLSAGTAMGGEFEEMEVIQRLARSKQGREAVAAACREALAADDPAVKIVAFNVLTEVEGAETDAYLLDLYESLGEDYILMLVTIAGTALYRASDGVLPEGAQGLYDRLARDLASDDRAARLKAAKLVALMPSERARALAVRGMQSPYADVRRWCVMSVAYAYGVFGESPDAYDAVVAALRDEDPSVRGFAARRLGDAGDANFVPQLLALLDDPDVEVRRGAASSVASLLGCVPTPDKDASKKLLKRLKAEPDGVTRCFLAEAYGAATAKEGYEKPLTDDGYWAFFAGEWREKDLDSYYIESESGGWCGG
jgi:hypothetical protein